jgi:2-oxoisovalerate dehydrogenase E1 component
LKRVVGADTFTPLAGAAFLVIPSEEEIVAAAQALSKPVRAN